MFKIILHDITSYMGSYFFRSLLLGLVCAIILFIVLTQLKKKGRYDGSKDRIRDKTIAFFLGIVYGYMVVGITFLCREPVFERVVALRPFSAPVGNPRLWAYQVENIIMFIPYGCIFPILIGSFEKWYRCLYLGIISSVLIETVQYITARGKAQVDDVLLNSAGMMIGWLIFTILATAHRKKKEKTESDV